MIGNHLLINGLADKNVIFRLGSSCPYQDNFIAEWTNVSKNFYCLYSKDKLNP